MSEAITNSSIKLFGMTIVVSEQRQSSSTTSDSSSVSKDISREAFTETIDRDNSSTNLTEETSTEAATSSSVIEKDSPSEAKSNEQEETIESGTTLVDKPADKILVPCPRCISKDTKFCYYNNNNHNQPRHFCKNCQRYWTNGGVMRNLPVGSGRRKTKSVTIPNYPHASSDAVNGIHSEQNGFFIYGSDESKASKNSSHVYGSSSGIPVVFYPTTPYWGTCSLSPPPMPLVSRTCSTLGKRVREEMIVSPSTSEIDNPVEETNAKRSSVLVPKTLRFDVPNEAARSSIWSALGIKSDNETSLSKAFEGKCVRNSNIDIAKMLLQANPAALHRSLNFQESV